MTNHERAENILKTIKPLLPDQVWQGGHFLNLLEFITVQLNEAQREAVEDALDAARYKLKELELLGRTKGYDKGFAAAKEKAARIVQRWIDNDCVGPNPAIFIRKMEP